MFVLTMRRADGGTMRQEGLTFDVATHNATLMFCVFPGAYIAAEITPCD